LWGALLTRHIVSLAMAMAIVATPVRSRYVPEWVSKQMTWVAEPA
jgi:hypothetical protein